MKPLRVIAYALTLMLTATSMTSCFTGVEGTRKITARDIKKKRITVTPEIRLMQDVQPQRAADWQPGKAFYVTDNRISLIFGPTAYDNAGARADSLAGSIIRLDSIGTATGFTGINEAIMYFSDESNNHLMYKTGIAADRLALLGQFTIPFTVEMSVVETADRLLRDKHFYYLAARRRDADGKETTGRRYQPVTIIGVAPGTDTRPLLIKFSDEAGTVYSVTATIGESRTATRNFNTLFAIDNPRYKYRDITDEVWQLIVDSKVQTGMTPQECMLALGSPDEHLRLPSTGGMVERWSYDNGIYLYFEDGHLARFR